MNHKRRFLVAHAPMLRAAGRRTTRIPCRVAVFPWAMPEHALTVLVRASVALGAAALIDPTPFSIGADLDGFRIQPNDFVPLRPLLDLLLVGNVEMAGGAAADGQLRRVAVGFEEAQEVFLIACSTHGRVPLRPPYTRWLDGSSARLGPECTSASESPAQAFGGEHPDGFDYSIYQNAAAQLQFNGMPVGEPLILDGLFEPGTRVETLMPDIAPRLFFDPSQPEDTARDVPLRLDTILVDTDRRVVDLTWRGFLKVSRPARAACERLVIGWVSPKTWDDEHADAAWQQILRELPRGEFYWATEREDVESGREPPPLEQEEALIARLASWDQSAAPTAELELAVRARIAAELAEQREPRREILARHGLDEFGWSSEERATLEELSHAPCSPEEAKHQREYADAFRAAQDSFFTPAENHVSIGDFARIMAAVEHGRHELLLQELGLGLGAVFRLDRRFRNSFTEDPVLEQEFCEALVRERRAIQDAKAPDDRAAWGEAKPTEGAEA